MAFAAYACRLQPGRAVDDVTVQRGSTRDFVTSGDEIVPKDSSLPPLGAEACAFS